MKLTKTLLRKLIQEAIDERSDLLEYKNRCGEKPKWAPGRAKGDVLKDMRAWWNCYKKKRSLPDGYPFADVNKHIVTPDLSQDPTGGAPIPPLEKTHAWNEQFKAQIFSLTRQSKNPVANLLQIAQLLKKYQRVIKPEMLTTVSGILNKALRELGNTIAPDRDIKSIKGGDTDPAQHYVKKGKESIETGSKDLDAAEKEKAAKPK